MIPYDTAVWLQWQHFFWIYTAIYIEKQQDKYSPFYIYIYINIYNCSYVAKSSDSLFSLSLKWLHSWQQLATVFVNLLIRK